jgi:hypothetical protein
MVHLSDLWWCLDLIGDWLGAVRIWISEKMEKTSQKIMKAKDAETPRQ